MHSSVSLFKMNSFIILFFLFITSTTYTLSINPCAPKTCGQGPNITYPFWLSDPMCGHPKFKVTCNIKNHPVLTISKDYYLIKDIFYGNHSLVVANAALYQEKCPIPSHNLSLHQSPFNISPSYTNFSLLYNCSQKPNVSYYTYPISCANNHDSQYSFASFHIEVLEYSNYSLGSCKRIVKAPLNIGALADMVSLLPLNYTEVLRTGFVLTWTEDNCPPPTGRKRTAIILGVVIPLSLISLCLLTYFLCKGNLNRKAGDENEGEDLLLFDFESDPHSTTNAPPNSLKTKGKTSELPLFSYTSVAAATGNFMEANKLGGGGFGPVYKGTLPQGQDIAVKRLSKISGQGVQEFRNEAILIAKVQHKNLVQLLGSCIQHDENILIYEYMPNKSLDFFLFDPIRRQMLDCATRIRIIDGIAQGLLYLHQYSRVRIIHRDLKPGNILLDSQMNPKISDFGTARMFGDNDETQAANTSRVVGTYGYMAPEYVMHGEYSTKSDVFSFGVMVLEIISGRKNRSFYQDDRFTLLGQAWHLWSSGRGLELMDPMILSVVASSTTTSMLLLRYLQTGLLCVQGRDANRPTMSEVVSMIVNEAPVPMPKQHPAFMQQRSMRNSISSSYERIGSINNLTLSTIVGR